MAVRELFQAVKLAAKSISKRKGRTLLTMLGVIIGIAAVITLMTFAQGGTRQMMEYYESMGSNQIQVSAGRWTSDPNDTGVFDNLYDFCLQLGDLVEGVTPSGSIWCPITYGAKNSQTMRYSPQLYLGGDQWGLCNNFEVEYGRNLSYLDVQKANQVCLVGERAKTEFFNYIDPIGETMYFNGIPFTVIGVFKQKDFSGNEWSMDNVILIPYTTQRAIAAGGGIGMSAMSDFVVKARSKEATTLAITRLDGFLKGLIGDPNSGQPMNGHFSVYSPNQGEEYANEAAKSQQRLLGGIAAISLLVGGIGIMNIMMVTVTERTREIGIRKAIGAERKNIIVQFLIEACMICGLGGILGILFGYGATLIVCKLALNMIMLPDVTTTVGAFGVSVLLGILFGLFPAVKASGLQPVAALRAD